MVINIERTHKNEVRNLSGCGLRFMLTFNKFLSSTL
jgi:hypothetical protein